MKNIAFNYYLYVSLSSPFHNETKETQRKIELTQTLASNNSEKKAVVVV